MPTLSQLRYIVAVDNERHFAKAAKKCHVSQPSMSMQIMKAEEELGVVIFDRMTKPIGVTDKGRELIAQARLILFEEEKLNELAKRSKTELSGDFSIGIIPTLAAYLLPIFVPGFSKDFPKVNLKIDEMKTEDIISGLRADNLDGGILATPLAEPGIEENPMFYESFAAYLGPRHPLMGKEKLQQEDLDPDDIWLLKEGHCLRNQVVNFCGAKNKGGIFNNVRFEGGSLETLVAMVQKCGGYTLVPELMAMILPQANIRNITPLSPTREVSIAIRKGHWKQDIAEAIAKTIQASIPSHISRTKKPSQTVLSI